MDKGPVKKGAKTRSVQIPVKVYIRIKKRLPRTEFKNVSQYVTYVLKEVLSNIEEEEKPVANESDESPYTEEEEEAVKERLRALGYMD